MKKHLTILLLFLCLSGFSQEITVSDPITFRTDDNFDVLGKLKGQYLLFQDKSTEFKVHALDENLREDWSKEIDLEKRRTKVIGIIPTKEDFSILYSYRIKNLLHVRARRYDPGANIIDSAIVKVYPKLFVTPNFKTIRSENKKIVLLYYIKEQKSIEALAFNLETMKVLWEKSIKPDDMTYHEDFEQMVINDQGDLFLILEKENRKSKKDEHHFQVHKVSSAGEFSSFKIHMQDHLTFDIHFSFDNKNQQLVAAGLYSDKNRGRSNGYFFINVPEDNPSNHVSIFEPYEEQFIKNLMGKKADLKKGIGDTNIQEIVHRNDGGILMVAERNRKLQRGAARHTPYNSGVLANMDYYFDDVFIISIHPDGETHWKNVLHKRQYSQDDDAIYSSFFLVKTPSSLRFLFNDEIKQENTVSEYVVKGNGKVKRNSVLSTEDQKIQLQFANAMQVASDEVIVPSARRNRLKIVKVKY